jgi:hypothetical protein
VLVDDAAKGSQFVTVGVLGDVTDAQLFGAKSHTFGNSSGDDRQRYARIGEEAHADAVLNVVALELEALVVNIAQVDAAVGQHAIDIEGNELDTAREGSVKHWERSLNADPSLRS